MRLLTPAVKYWVCKSAPGFLYEAMECLGGNGYVEEGILARHYRESPVNAIWEGSGNVMCLDVLRALSREPEAAPAVLHQLAGETRGLTGGGDAVAFIGKALRRPDGERVARLAVEKLALLAAAAALNQVRRARPNCSRPPDLPGIMPACTALWISLQMISADCWSGHYQLTVWPGKSAKRVFAQMTRPSTSWLPSAKDVDARASCRQDALGFAA